MRLPLALTLGTLAVAAVLALYGLLAVIYGIARVTGLYRRIDEAVPPPTIQRRFMIKCRRILVLFCAFTVVLVPLNVAVLVIIVGVVAATKVL